MDASDIEQQCNQLRNHLKAWEKKFASEHDGRKAGRDDIKADAAISQKYKDYNRLRSTLSRKPAPQTPKRTSSRRSITDIDCTPEYEHVAEALVPDIDGTPKSQNRVQSLTPLKRKRGVEAGPDRVDSATEPPSPEGPAFIGPTPQRDGKVLGLFDILPAQTPSRSRIALVDIAPNSLQTPSRKTFKPESEASITPRARGEKTPQSVGKRFLLDKFVTPKKIKLGEAGTPSSISKEFETPAFLRRHNALDAIEEDDEPTPRPAPWKRITAGRSLSAMIRSMRKQEDDRLDEEADIMRELEMEAEGLPLPKKQKTSELLVGDSQVTMPLGPDGPPDTDDENDGQQQDDAPGQNDNSKRIWKKRGQKRQTRRVIMRPNLSKPKPLPVQPLAEDSEEDQNAVPESQTHPDHASDRDLSDDDFSEYASDVSHSAKKRTGRAAMPKETSTSSEVTSEDKVGRVTQIARKVKATAHANYRRLKIKSKGGNGGKSRFGRRR